VLETNPDSKQAQFAVTLKLAKKSACVYIHAATSSVIPRVGDITVQVPELTEEIFRVNAVLAGARSCKATIDSFPVTRDGSRLGEPRAHHMSMIQRRVPRHDRSATAGYEQVPMSRGILTVATCSG